jgi:hypothetical protein
LERLGRGVGEAVGGGGATLFLAVSVDPCEVADGWDGAVLDGWLAMGRLAAQPPASTVEIKIGAKKERRATVTVWVLD